MLILPLIFALFASESPAHTETAESPKNAVSREKTLKIGGGELHISLPLRGVSVSAAAEIDWLSRAAKSISSYFDGRYPVKTVLIEVRADGGGDHIGGTTWWGRRIEMRLGHDVTDDDLSRDWTATHEMFHLAFPQIEPEQNWMGEGLATYLEPFARVRVGDLSVDKLWSDMIEGLPQGLPAAGDLGLNKTHTWGRTYWGGALFWFLADVQIREKSAGKFSLDSCMRAILAAGGDGSRTWSQDRVFSLCDKLTGLTVMRDLRATMVDRPGAGVDLPALWKRLGISRSPAADGGNAGRGGGGDQGRPMYNDKAELAGIRRAMTSRATSSKSN